MNQSPTTPPGVTLDVVLSWVLLIGLSLWGGAASFYRKLRDGHARAFNITELLGELVVSGFTGVLTANLCDSMGWSTSWKYFLVGIASHMGSRALFKLEGVLNAKLNLPPDPPAPAAAGDDHAQ